MKYLFLALVLFSIPSFADNQCFRKDTIQNFTTPDNTHVIVQIWGKKYTVETEVCIDLPWVQSIGFESFTSNVCKFDHVLLLDTFTNQVKGRCMILSVTKN